MPGFRRAGPPRRERLNNLAVSIRLKMAQTIAIHQINRAGLASGHQQVADASRFRAVRQQQRAARSQIQVLVAQRVGVVGREVVGQGETWGGGKLENAFAKSKPPRLASNVPLADTA
jgi:hypothetical protein